MLPYAVLAQLTASFDLGSPDQGHALGGTPGAEPLGLLSLTPAFEALLRRHDLMLPLLQAAVAEEQLAAVELGGELAEEARRQWLQGQPLAEVQERLWDQRGWSAADLDWQMLRQARLLALARGRFGAKAEARYLQRKGQLDLVVYSLLRTSDANLARELYLRIAAGEATFADLAQQYSGGPERLSQGLIGPKPLSAAHPALAERLRTARDGDVMEPFAVGDLWLVARREQLQSTQFDAAMADRMALELLQESIQHDAAQRLAACNAQFSAEQVAP